jgi:hypothetical protein
MDEIEGRCVGGVGDWVKESEEKYIRLYSKITLFIWN